MTDQPDREGMLVQLRRERGLTSGGDYRLPLVSLSRLILQSGLTIGFSKLAILIVIAALVAAFGGTLFFTAIWFMPSCAGFVQRDARCRICSCASSAAAGRRNSARNSRTRSTSSCASLRAGHPVPVAISMVARELPDPIGSEFGIASDEITYGADLETAMRNLYFRVGQDDLPLFVTAVAIQGSTGGNLSEILENLSAVIRLRFKMRRKIRALAAEGRASALILSSLPIAMFGIINLVSPDFYSSVWHESITKIALGAAGCWMGVGNFIMYRLVNFKI